MIIINCQSLFSKKDSFSYLVSEQNPDFIIGTESWLLNSVLNNEVFPPNFRKDRDSGYGGVFIACRSNFQCKLIEMVTECELVACEVQLSRGPPLVIISVYHPPYNDYAYMENLTDSINYIVNNYKNSTIWFGGDLNLPNINWVDNTITGTNYPFTLCNIFLDLVTSHGFSQMNLQPTRYNHILDIFLTNRPALVSDIKVIPGISDHDSFTRLCVLNVI